MTATMTRTRAPRYFKLAAALGAMARRENNEHLEVLGECNARARQEGLDPMGGMVPWFALGSAPVTLDEVARGTRANVSTVQDIVSPTVPGPFAALLRNLSTIGRAGATFLDLPGHKANIVQQTGTGGATWVAENPGSDSSRSNLTAAVVAMAAKTIMSTTAVSRQSIFSAQGGGWDLEAIIRSDLAQAIAIAIDLAGVNGLGASNQPLGILQDTLVSTFALGTNGGTLDRTAASTLEFTVATANADRPNANLAYVTTPAARKKARLTQDFSGSSVPMWHDDNTVLSYPAFASQQMPSNLTKGTSTTVCSAWIFGAFEQLIVASFGGGIDVVVDPYVLKLQNMVDVTVRAFVDVGDARPSAFQKILDCITT